MKPDVNDNFEQQAVTQNSAINNNMELQALLQEMEVKRKSLYKKQNISSICIFLTLIVMVAGPFILPLPFYFYAVPFVFFCFGCNLVNQTKPELLELKNTYKEKILVQAMKIIDDSIIFQPDSGISKREFTASLLFDMDPNVYSTEDLMIGKIDKTEFYLSEVKAEYKSKPGKIEFSTAIFKGVIFRADFNKNFEGITILSADRLRLNISPYDKVIPGTPIEMENTAFNKLFNIRTTNEIEARYLLSPLLMEKLIELNKKSSGTISVSFINNSIYIAFPRVRQLFEVQTHKSFLNAEALEEDLYVIRLMCFAIEELRLNTRIWGKN
ncbi:DUF3137 domain-containing protein [Pedobacter caeni]|uniref:Galanin n=1 Tax=Pedobacter caeni TaxID=288992 RepID=A0A1M5GI98_9SPHI|nr:DUF3137 domain-containing protein [Pedobacter caeni]SHG03242.1 Protein of unknown function [Pedobacter caeni]